MTLREYIKKLKEWGLLVEVDAEVDWNLEMGAIDSMLGRLGGPAVLFNNVKGYPGMRSVIRHFTGSWEKPWRNIALILGLSPEASYSELLDEMWRRFQGLIKPVQVSTGPCKENKALGKDVDLFKFPWPYIHQGDGGRYLTLDTCITKSLNLDWTNWGNYRFQVQTKTRVTGLVNMYGHMGYMYYQEYQPKNLPMPACIVLGGPVEDTMASSSKIPFGASEVEWVGALAQEPVELVKAETSGILVPAQAEIVIEGEFRPHERMDEGPFGEFFGYMHGPRIPRPVFRAHCITWRNDPIIPGLLAEGMPGAGSLFGLGRLAAGYQYSTLARTVGAYARHINAKNGFLVGVKVPPGLRPELIVHRTMSQPIFQSFNTMMVGGPDDDIDDTDGVIEAIYCKAHPNKFQITDADLPKSTMSVFHTPEERKKGYSAKWWVDTTWPSHWPSEKVPRKVAFENSFPGEVQEWVAQNWKRLGLEGEPKVKR